MSARPAIMTSWLKQTLSHRFNPSGISSFADVAARYPYLALPHLSFPDVRHVNWHEVRRLGFQGIVLDKDNTLTAPCSLSEPPSPSPFNSAVPFSPAKSPSLAILPYDLDGTEAKALEEAIGGIHVIR